MARRRTRSDSLPLAGGTRADGVGAGFVNNTTGLGSQLDGETGTSFYGGCDLGYEERCQLMRNFALARRICTAEADAALGEGIIVKGELNGAPVNVRVGGKPDEKAEAPDPIALWSMRFGLFELVEQARAQAYAHGSAMWVFGVDDGRKSNEPLDLGAVRRLHWVKVITGGSSGRVSASRWGMDSDQPRFEQPTHYWVTFARSGMQAEFHWTRVHQWIGVPLNEEERALLTDYGGSSLLDLVWLSLKGYGVAHQRMLAAIGLLSQGVWTNQDLALAIDAGAAGEVADHHERLRMGGGQFGDYVLSEGESYGVVGRPINGLPDAIDRTRDALVADSGQGEATLLRAQPSLSGLNNDADASIRGWYSEVASRWATTYAEPLSMFYAISSRARNGPTQGIPILALEAQQPSLWSMTPEEAGKVRVLNSDARAKDRAAELVSVAEQRTDTTLSDEYELAPDAVATVVEETATPDEVEVADDGLMPQDETPLSLRKAGAIIGRKSPEAVLGFAKSTGAPVFKVNGQRVVFASHLRAAMRESQIV